MATITNIQTLPTEPQQATLNPEKGQPVPLQDLSPTGHRLGKLPGPEAQHVVTVQETWKYPTINRWRLSAVFFAFINFGMNDACYGALIPYVRIAANIHV